MKSKWTIPVFLSFQIHVSSQS